MYYNLNNRVIHLINIEINVIYEESLEWLSTSDRVKLDLGQLTILYMDLLNLQIT